MSKRTKATQKADDMRARAWELIQQITDNPADDGCAEDTDAIIEILEAIDGGE